MKEKNFLTIDPKDISVSELHGILLSSVAPRPIALASTIDRAGNVNLSPFSFFNVFSANPPIMIFSPSRRGRDNTVKDSYVNLKEVPEVVINIVNYAMVEQVSLSSTEYQKGVNEFIKSGLTQIPSDLIRPPRVAESPVSFECEVDDIIELGKEGGAGNLVLSRVIKIHVDQDYLGEDQKLNTAKLDLVGRMGGMWYTRANGDALFEIPKPLATKGIGVDSLPAHARDSTWLTGNELGRLGNLKSLPDEKQISNLKSDSVYQQIITKGDVQEVHKAAKLLISKNRNEEALILLCSVD